MALTEVAMLAVQGALVLGFSPFVMSVFAKLKARSQGRRGPPWLQPYFNLAKLLRKGEVAPEPSTPLFAWAPAVAFAAVFAAAMLVPTFYRPAGLQWGDLFAVVFLFSLARVMTALAGMDAGSSFGGFGASREAVMGGIVEPTMIAVVLWGAVVAGSTGGGALATPDRPVPFLAASASYLLAFGALAVLFLAETARIPVDNPATHLELTMIHEAMVLEYNGPKFGLVEWGRSVKQFAVLSLMAVLVLPFGTASTFDVPSLGGGLALFLGKVLLLAGAMALLEASTAKLRLFRLPELFTISAVLAILAALAALVAGGATVAA